MKKEATIKESYEESRYEETQVPRSIIPACERGREEERGLSSEKQHPHVQTYAQSHIAVRTLDTDNHTRTVKSLWSTIHPNWTSMFLQTVHEEVSKTQ